MSSRDDPQPSDPRTSWDDFALLGAWRGGDESAGSVLFRRHYHGVHAFFARRVPEVADDLTQRTLLACVESLDSFRREASFRGYLFGIAKNQLLKHLRSQARFDAMRSRTHDAELTRTSPSAMVGRRQEQHLLLLAFSRLPAELQLGVELFYWQGLRAHEIAQVMDVPTSTVTTRLSRARQLLREYIDDLGGPETPRAALLADLEGWTRSLADAHSQPR